jgi:CBS domain-containing protein
MVPGFPLDGGRVARAIVWWLTGNYLRATRWTAFLGQAFAVIAVVAGFFSLSQNSVYLGDPIWNFLIAMFLWQASRGHLRSAEFRENLRGVPIGNLVRHSVPLKAEWPLTYAADIIAMGGPLSALPVMREGQLVGVLSMDLLRNLPRMGWGGVRVEDIMQPINSVRTIDANIDLYEAIRNTDLHDQRVLLVTKQQNPIGLLSQRELLAFAEQHSRST